MILCVGDYIEDIYTFGTATRICPEGPVPVIVPEESRVSAGGAGLVVKQLQELGAVTDCWFGSKSRKTRIFAGSHLVCRLDEDRLPYEPLDFPDEILRQCECVVVSDYGKGGIFEEIAEEIVKISKPLFVDAKHHWHWYGAANTTWFPNEQECSDAEAARGALDLWPGNIQIVQKLGARGCKWNDCEIPATVSDVVDTTGAGDIFLAAFVYANMCERFIPSDCLRFANILAGESCRHRGTFVVGREFAQSVLGTLRPSRESVQPGNGQDLNSISATIEPNVQFRRIPAEQSIATSCIQDVDYSKDRGVRTMTATSALRLEQFERCLRIPQKSPSDPKESSDILPQSGLTTEERWKKLAREIRNSNATEHRNERKSGQGQD